MASRDAALRLRGSGGSCVFPRMGLCESMFQSRGHRRQPIAAKRQGWLNSAVKPVRRPCIFLACLCAVFCFLLTTPDYTGIDGGNIVPYPRPEPDAWGARFYPAFGREAHRDNAPRLVAHLTERYRVDLSLAENLAAWAVDHEHGNMILAIMSVESTFRPATVGPGGRGLGQINPIHLEQGEIRDARRSGRPTLVDTCGIEHEKHLYEPGMNFCATGTLFGSFLERRGSVEKALYDYVGSRGRAGEVYARKVLRAHAEIAEVIR